MSAAWPGPISKAPRIRPVGYCESVRFRAPTAGARRHGPEHCGMSGWLRGEALFEEGRKGLL